MDISMKIPETSQILAVLRSRKEVQGGTAPRVEVGYDTPYALYVHEDLQARHEMPTQAKYLETPARQERDTLRKLAFSDVLSDNNLATGLRKAGDHLLKLSQELVPVATGTLKRSGYVKEVMDVKGGEV